MPSCKYAPVGPIKVLQGLAEANELGSYLLIEAPDIERGNYGEYIELFKDFKGTLILDHGAGIGAGLNTHSDYTRFVKNLPVTHCILPDYIGDWKRSLQHSIHYFREYYGRTFQNGRCKPMFVVQGKNEVTCMKWVAGFTKWIQEQKTGAWEVYTLDEVMIGVPYHLTDKLGSRDWLVAHIINRLSHIPGFSFDVHLLGFSGNPLDDKRCTYNGAVIGVDSAQPVWWGSDLEIAWHEDAPTAHQRYDTKMYGGRWSELECNKTVVTNVKNARKWLNPPGLASN